jgi:hypothetical protein
MTISFLAPFLPLLAGVADGAFRLPAGLLASERAAGFLAGACSSHQPCLTDTPILRPDFSDIRIAYVCTYLVIIAADKINLKVAAALIGSTAGLELQTSGDHTTDNISVAFQATNTAVLPMLPARPAVGVVSC